MKERGVSKREKERWVLSLLALTLTAVQEVEPSSLDEKSVNTMKTNIHTQHDLNGIGKSIEACSFNSSKHIK